MFRCYKVLLIAVSFLTLTSFPYSQENHIRIVRVSYAEGSVLLNNQGVTANMPLIEGNVLATGVNSFAEIEFEDGSTLRVGPNTQLMFAQLARLSSGEALTRVDLDEGEAEIKTSSRMPGEFTVGAANKTIRVPGGARVRVLSAQGDPLELAVWAGEVTVHDPESGQDVAVEKEETFTLAADDPQQYDLEKGIDADALDQFSESRDQYLASDYVSVNGNLATPPPVVIGSGFVDPCQVYYWYPGFPQNCFSPFYFYPSFSFGYTYVPGFYYHHHHHHHPFIHPPSPAVAKATNSVDRGRVTVRTGEPSPHAVRTFNDENFKRRAPVQEEQAGKLAVDQEKESGKSNKDNESTRSRHAEPAHSVESRHSSSPQPVSHVTHSSVPGNHSSSVSSHSSSSSYSGSSSSHSSGGSPSGGSSSHSSSSSSSSAGSGGRSK